MAEGSGEKRDRDNIWYSFRTEELELLLAAAGTKSWYGPEKGLTRKAVSREEVNRLLAGMYRKGIVSFDDGRLVMADEQKKIAEVIRDAAACASSVCGVKSGVPYIAYFCTGKVVILRADVAGSGRVVIKMIDEADWPGFLLEESPVVCRTAGAGGRKNADENASADFAGGESSGSDDNKCGGLASAELEINGEGLRRAGTELAGCGDVLKKISSELYSSISQADDMDRGMFKSLDDAQKTLELKGLKLDAMAEVLVKAADEADRAEKMILDHEALMKAANMKPGESDLAGMTEALEKAVKK